MLIVPSHQNVAVGIASGKHQNEGPCDRIPECQRLATWTVIVDCMVPPTVTLGVCTWAGH